MMNSKISRRAFVKRSALALGASSIALDLSAQTTLSVRPEWQTFKTTPQFDSLLRAIALMKANANAVDPNSWAYWTAMHVNFCPHGTPYFLAWHRGYLYFFERRLRAISGDSQLVLPYWDYYANATIPAEFTNPNNANPLYADRLNTNVRPALTMAPFSPLLTRFQRGLANAFEPSIEDAPHNPVHDIIGSVMATMQSPVDPIFWLHHANVDRLWVAWVAAGAGRTMPGLTNRYWADSHVYNSAVSLARTATYNTSTVLGYRYANERFPAKLPLAQLSAPEIRRVQAMPNDPPASVPAVGSFRMSSTRATGKGRFAVSGALDVGLDERSISVQLPSSSEHSRALEQIGNGKAGSIPGRSEAYRSVHIVLDNAMLAELARKGGYYYQIYLNIPSTKGRTDRSTSVLVGTLGAFRINAAAHHEGAQVRLQYPVRRMLAGATAEELGMMSVSFVRVNGERSPRGGAIGLGEVRLEVATDDED